MTMFRLKEDLSMEPKPVESTRNEIVVGLQPTVYLDYNPGDMTRYRVIAVCVDDDKKRSDRTWCVTFPDIRASCWVDEGSHIDTSWIIEKLRWFGAVMNEHTAQMMAEAIARVVPRCTAPDRSEETLAIRGQAQVVVGMSLW